MFSEALELIKKYDTIIIHRHTNPDGDALGSQIGLKHIILENFPTKKVYMVGDEAKRYSFMEDSVMDEIDDSIFANSLCIILDSAATHLVNDTRYTKAKNTLRFDHHIFCEKFCDVEYVDTSFESCCGLITYFATQSGLKLNVLASKSLYTGMVTDSGRFAYDSTSSKTFLMASELLKQPFQISDIYSNLYCEDYENVKLRASFIMKINITDKHVGYIYTTKKELDELNAKGIDTFSVSRGMVNTMSNIRGVNSWVNFTETGDEIFVEIRSSKYNINPIAVKYGGGGHQKASGASVKSYEEAMEMVKDLESLEDTNGQFRN